jgi:plastocyanin
MSFSVRAVPLRALAAGLVTLCLSLAPASSALAAATSWKALVGSDTPDHAIQGNAFFPGDLSINVGDTITWNANAGEIHTVAFEYGPPPAGLSGFDIVTTPAGGTTFNGSGWFNSGLLTDASPPPPGESNSYTLTFTSAGDYTFHCLVHSTMQGTLHVLPTTQAVPHTQSFYTQQNISAENQLLSQGTQVLAAGLSTALSLKTPAVTAGDGELFSTSSVAVLRFLPNFDKIHVGDTVTWTNRDPETPHTVTFGPEPPGGPFGALFPIGATGGQATISGPVTSTINSGFLAAPGPFGFNGTQFKVTFTAPGTYTYYCALHDDLGMVGSITVLPR